MLIYCEGELIVEDYEKQIEEITRYFRNNEKKKEDFKLGVELEHFIIDKNTLKTVSYYGDNGVEETLKDLLFKGWEGMYEGNNLLGLINKNNTTVTLEPGSQIELSIEPLKEIKDIEKEYFDFLYDIIPILEKKNQNIIAVGYQPNTKISDIRLIPKQRYDFMYEYFKTKGSHAHNMMKGTASLQVSVDYKSEEDYIKKTRIANALTPVIYDMFDNCLYFEGGIWNKFNLRTYIWENCDKDRCGTVEGVFDEDFGYAKYAEYILNRPIIFTEDKKGDHFTGEKLFKEMFDPNHYSIEELEHALTMFFPDVRTKKYIEIRIMDGVPYPLNFSAIALWKGLLYNEDSLNFLYDHIKNMKAEDIKKGKKEIIEKGLGGIYLGRKVNDLEKWLLDISKKGLNGKELDYILPLEEMVREEKTPRRITEGNMRFGKRESLNWCVINNII